MTREDLIVLIRDIKGHEGHVYFNTAGVDAEVTAYQLAVTATNMSDMRERIGTRCYVSSKKGMLLVSCGSDCVVVRGYMEAIIDVFFAADPAWIGAMQKDVEDWLQDDPHLPAIHTLRAALDPLHLLAVVLE